MSLTFLKNQTKPKQNKNTTKQNEKKNAFRCSACKNSIFFHFVQKNKCFQQLCSNWHFKELRVNSLGVKMKAHVFSDATCSSPFRPFRAGYKDDLVTWSCKTDKIHITPAYTKGYFHWGTTLPAEISKLDCNQHLSCCTGNVCEFSQEVALGTHTCTKVESCNLQ